MVIAVKDDPGLHMQWELGGMNGIAHANADVCTFYVGLELPIYMPLFWGLKPVKHFGILFWKGEEDTK